MRRLSSAARRRHALGGECLRGEEEDETGERNQERAASTGRAARSFLGLPTSRVAISADADRDTRPGHACRA